MARVAIGSTVGYEPCIAYTYEVAGRTYPGEHRGDRSGSETVAARALRAWPVGGTVPIHYDPARPARGLIDPRFGPGRVAFGTCCGLFFLGAGLLGLWELS